MHTYKSIVFLFQCQPYSMISLWSILLVIVTTQLSGEEYIGIVQDSITKLPVPNATILLITSNELILADHHGRFHLESTLSRVEVNVSSVGYHSKRILLIPNYSTVIVLIPKDIESNVVEVVDSMSAEDIVRAAIKKKNVNSSRVTSSSTKTNTYFSATLHRTKLMRDDPSRSSMILLTSADILTTTIPTSRRVIRINHKLQTKNVRSDSNLAVLEELFDPTLDRISIGPIAFVSPIADDATSIYRYELIDDESNHGEYHTVSFRPITELYPTFTGRMSISHKDFQVINVEFSPSSQWVIPYVRNLTIRVEYKLIDSLAWLPSIQLVEAEFQINVIAGLFAPIGTVVVRTIAEQCTINTGESSIIDSMFRCAEIIHKSNFDSLLPCMDDLTIIEYSPEKLTVVSNMADTVLNDSDSLINYFSISEKELEDLHIADSLNLKNDSIAAALKLPFPFTPIYLGQLGIHGSAFINRASQSGWFGGPIFRFEFGNARAEGSVGLSQIGWIPWSLSIGYGLSLGAHDSLIIRLIASDFMDAIQQPFDSQWKVGTTDFRQISYSNQRINYYVDEWNIETYYKMPQGMASIRISDIRLHDQTLSNSIINLRKQRLQTIDFDLVSDTRSSFESLFLSRPKMRFDVKIMMGKQFVMNETFGQVSLSGGATFPLLNTGFDHVKLDIDAGFAITTMNSPIQYSIIANPRFISFGNVLSLSTLPFNKYGARMNGTLVTSLNLTDYWWRFVRLQLYKGKGLDLLVSYGALILEGNTQALSSYGYKPFEGVYQEIGIGLGHIPLFITDLFNIYSELRIPIGLAKAYGSKPAWIISVSTIL